MSRPVVFVSAGEPSGDAHAAAFVRALRDSVPDVVLEGVGGPHLAAAGVSLLQRIEGLTVLGFVEALAAVPAHLRLLKALERRFARGDIKLVVVVDYPGFHLRVAEAARRAGLPVLYYIAPKLWAWGEGRVKRLARDVKRVAAILPFEEEWFNRRGVQASYVGNPLLDREPFLERTEAKRALGLDPAKPVLGVFPGSRGQETRRLWPPFRDAAKSVMLAHPGLQVVVAATAAGSYEDADGLRVVRGRPRECFAAADTALCKSGTTTLEAALAGSPMVVAYRLSALSHAIARRVARVQWISLVNLVAGRSVVPELIQGQADAAQLAAALTPLLDPDSGEVAAQLAGLAEVRRRMGGAGAAERVAAIAREMLAA